MSVKILMESNDVGTYLDGWGMSICNTPDIIYLICIPTLAVSGTKLFYFLVVRFLSPCVLSLSCISYHVIMCIAFAYVFFSCIRAFSPLSVS